MFIKDSHIDKAKIETQKIVVENTLEELNKAEKIFNSLKEGNLEEKINYYNDIDNKIILHNKKISEKSIDISKSETKIESLNSELLNSKEVLGKLEKLISSSSEDAHKIKEELNKINEQIAKLDARKLSIVESNGRMEQEIKNLIKERDYYLGIRTKWSLYETYLQAVGKKGIPNQILSSQIPAINQEIRNVLAGILQYDIELQVEEDTNNLDIYINYGGINRRIIETCCGMEKLFASTVIRMALLKCATNMPICDTVFLDEAFDGLDKSNMMSAEKIFEILKKHFKSIILISHKDELKSMVDQIIEVKKEKNDTSKIVYN